MVEEEESRARGEDEAAAVNGCDFCGEVAAVVYCQADSARLCLGCDRHVHAANFVSSRHHRALLCELCRAAPAAFLCSSAPHRGLLCSNCDFDAHPAGSDLHDRRSVEPFSGCPSVLELATILGVGWGEKLGVSGEEGCTGEENGGDDGGWLSADEMWVWEAPPVLRLEDLVVPTTSLHGFQAMGIPPLSKNRNPACGKHKEEILQQLNELVKTETHEGNDGGEHDPVLEFQSLLPNHNLQQGNLSSDFDHDSTCLVAPSSEASDLRWNHYGSQERTDSAVFSYEQLMGCSSMVNPSFPDGHTDVHQNTRHACVGEGDPEHPVTEEKITSLPTKGGSELCADRDSVISRYKQKRKTRRYDKLIRYESRKARADSRTRIKGRFAKVNQVEDS